MLSYVQDSRRRLDVRDGVGKRLEKKMQQWNLFSQSPVGVIVHLRKAFGNVLRQLVFTIIWRVMSVGRQYLPIADIAVAHILLRLYINYCILVPIYINL